ncbi:MAG: hypothetical protein EAZ70_00250 [Runella slithyformis]|nr:MAG: hypothetical protein EAY79_00645 [Runella slithyformis]TAE97488.1 MAG: hypothetical protein EAZ80_07400 [Runella slithyformis]TAF29980.1 MAG: hypothetical protein EAZ70_00250 [Runella slithyformis]TAF49096.1 MAG: hypothetical protein EAZ63_02315 [Runella slithyformis]TAF83591.1 MAG: hypothetical protein EAZ50_00405 [Runella slithyformis]
MNPNDILRSTLMGVFYLLLHIFVARQLVLFDYAFCFIYVGVILTLPYEISLTALLLIAFGTGLVADTFDNTLGMHTASAVLMAYLRPTVIGYQMAQKVSEGRFELSLRGLGLPTFLSYALILTTIHHATLLLIEASSIGLLFVTMLKILASIVFTLLALLLTQLFFR